jgi:hypothetical protein
MTSASSTTKPEVPHEEPPDGARHGASPVAQSTSVMTPQDRQTWWWWLSPTRASYRAGEPCGWMHETGVGQHPEHVVDRLVGDRVQAGAGGGDERLGVQVRMGVDGVQDGQARLGDPQAGGPQVPFEVLAIGHVRGTVDHSLEQVKKRGAVHRSGREDRCSRPSADGRPLRLTSRATPRGSPRQSSGRVAAV